MSSPPKYAVFALMAFALLVRGGMLLADFPALRADPDDYRRLAENLVERGTLGYGDRPTAFRAPLYPLFLAACVTMGPWSTAAIGLSQLAMGLATVWIVFRMAERWRLGNYSILAAALVACDPILLSQSTVVMTETLATLLVVLAVAALSWSSQRETAGQWILAGVCLGLAILCRPTFLPWAILATLAASRFAKRRMMVFLAILLQATLVLMPWCLRNQVRLGRAIVTTTHGGYTLLLGNNPHFYEYLRCGNWGTAWRVEEFERQRQALAANAPPLSEIDADRLAYEEARENMCREPAMFAYSCLVRVGRLWCPLPHQVAADESSLRRWSRYAVGAWYVLEFSLAVLGASLWIRRRSTRATASAQGESGVESPRSPISDLPSPPPASAQGKSGVESGGESAWMMQLSWLLLAACFSGVHVLYWSDMRMRAPLMPGVALATAVGLAWIAERLRNRKVKLASMLRG